MRYPKASGIPTVSLSIMRTPTERVKPPRTLALRMLCGQRAGAAGDGPTRAAVVLAALALLKTAVEPGIPVPLDAAAEEEVAPVSLNLPDVTLPDVNGRPTRLHDLLGAKTLIFMWGSW